MYKKNVFGCEENKRGINIYEKIIFTLLLLLFLNYDGSAQVIYDFGTGSGRLTSGTGLYNNGTNSTGIFNNLPNASGLGFFYGFSGSGAILQASNPGLSRLGSYTEAEAAAGSGSNFVKFGILKYSPQGTNDFTMMKYDFVFAGDSISESNSSSGIWYFCIGDGAGNNQFMNNNTTALNTKECGVCLRWTFIKDTLTLERLDGSSGTDNWVTVTGFTWRQKFKYSIEIYCNVGTSSATTYTRAAIGYTLQMGTMDIYVNDSKICNGVNVAYKKNATGSSVKKMDSYAWYGTGASGSDKPYIFIDNTVTYPTAPVTYGYYTKKSTSALDLSLLSSWTNDSTGTAGTSPTSWIQANSTWYIRNYKNSGTFTLSSGNLIIPDSNNSHFELGDNGNTAQFTVPQGKISKGDLDVRTGGYLIVQSDSIPNIRTTEWGSTVLYSNGSDIINYPIYYNLIITSGTKSSTLDYIIDGSVTVGDGTNAAGLIIPSGIDLYGKIYVKNYGKLTVQSLSTTMTIATLDSGSTVEYSAPAAQITQASLVYYNLIINNSGGVTMSGNNTVNGTLTLTSGNLTLNGKILTLNGNVTGTGMLSGSNSSGIVICGTGNAGTISFSTGANMLKTLTMNRTSSGIVNLANYLNVTDSLTLTNGIIACTDSISLGTSTTSPGVLSFTKPNYTSWISGRFQRYIPQGAGTINKGAIEFPVGSTRKWGGMRLLYGNGTSTGGTLSARFKQWDGGNFVPSLFTDSVYVVDVYCTQAYWTVKNSGVSGTYEINLDLYNFGGLNPDSTKRQNLRVMKRVDTLYAWTVQGNHKPGNGSYTQWTARRQNLTDFCDFTLGSYHVDNSFVPDDPMPVTLQSFSSVLNGRNVTLKWVTSAEVNNSGFEVERKSQTSDWSKSGFVKGTGNSNEPVAYKFEDDNLYSGKYQYRLKQIDYNGHFEYFSLAGDVEISLPKNIELSQNYPNPFNPMTNIDFKLPADSRVTLSVFDIAGREVARLLNNEFKTADYYTVKFDGSKLSSGVYFYSLQAGSFTQTKKLILIK